MKYTLLFILSFLLLLSACTNSTSPEDKNEAFCTYVYDGDTYKCIYNSDTIVVRHLYIDCYEIHRGERLEKQAERNHISVDSALTLGLKAKEFVKNLILDKYICLIRIQEENDKDVYGRYLRVVLYKGQRLDSMLLKKGLAFEYKPFSMQ